SLCSNRLLLANIGRPPDDSRQVPLTTMRIFIALDIENAIRDRISRFMDGVREFAPDARWVRPESLHVTLKFIGEKSAEAVEQVKEALAAVKGQPVEMGFRGHGFFPTAKSARVFWVGIECGPGHSRGFGGWQGSMYKKAH